MQSERYFGTMEGHYVSARATVVTNGINDPDAERRLIDQMIQFVLDHIVPDYHTNDPNVAAHEVYLAAGTRSEGVGHLMDISATVRLNCPYVGFDVDSIGTHCLRGFLQVKTSAHHMRHNPVKGSPLVPA